MYFASPPDCLFVEKEDLDADPLLIEVPIGSHNSVVNPANNSMVKIMGIDMKEGTRKLHHTFLEIFRQGAKNKVKAQMAKTSFNADFENPDILTLAIHVRLGDVGGREREWGTPNDYYYKLLDQMLPNLLYPKQKDIAIHVFTSEAKEDFVYKKEVVKTGELLI